MEPFDPPALKGGETHLKEARGSPQKMFLEAVRLTHSGETVYVYVSHANHVTYVERILTGFIPYGYRTIN